MGNHHVWWKKHYFYGYFWMAMWQITRGYLWIILNAFFWGEKRSATQARRSLAIVPFSLKLEVQHTVLTMPGNEGNDGWRHEAWHEAWHIARDFNPATSYVRLTLRRSRRGGLKGNLAVHWPLPSVSDEFDALRMMNFGWLWSIKFPIFKSLWHVESGTSKHLQTQESSKNT